MLENTIKKHITTYLKSLQTAGEPLWFYKTHGGPMQTAGIPDLHITFHGLSIWLEIKTDKGQPTKLQSAMMDLIRKAGGIAHIVRSADDVRRVIDVERDKWRDRMLLEKLGSG